MPNSMTGPDALVLHGVTAGYDGRPAISDVGLTVAAGSVCALLGSNGAGKSTAARVACGLLPPIQGRVIVAGAPPRRARIGLAPQETALFPALTARENVRLVARLCGVPFRQRETATRRALALTGCEPRANQPVHTLSGGWRRRANLAAALVGEPQLVVADEPTEGVDATTRGVLAEAMRACARAGAGCLLISHDAAFVAETADWIGVMAEGRLVSQGTPAGLLAETFGEARLLSVRLPRAASAAATRDLSAAGLTISGDGLEWRRLDADALGLAKRLAALVESEAGEIAVRRPGLEDLVARVSGTLT